MITTHDTADTTAEPGRQILEVLDALRKRLDDLEARMWRVPTEVETLDRRLGKAERALVRLERELRT